MINPDDKVLNETNLIPSGVFSDAPPVITNQPRGHSLQDPKRISHHYRQQHPHRHSNAPTGLARVSVAETLLARLVDPRFSCNNTIRYSVADISEGSDNSVILKGEEDFSGCCDIAGLRNVVLRDMEDLPVARACFKEKHWFVSSLVSAVYSPPEALIGKIEEDSNCFVMASKFILGNADGNHLFRVDYIGGIFSSNYSVKSVDNEEEEVAKILEKSFNRIRIQFLCKMSITNKLILVGFCIGMLHKHMSKNLEKA